VIGIEHKPGGGWMCKIKGCRYDREGYHDAATHGQMEHPELNLTFRKDTMHFYITAAPTPERLREVGAI